MKWNDEIIVRLCGFWLEGHSTAEIGRRIGATKNAVIGKVRRLGLPPRRSPIRLIGPTLPPLPAVAVALEVSTPLINPRPAPPPRPAAATPTAHPPVRVVLPRPIRTCCWPIGEPRTKSFRFCDDDVVPGKSYCGDHAQLAYVKVPGPRGSVLV